MRKKITSLSVLLLSGAFLLTSCVKDEELESTKNLRTAKETREAEKLAEEKALADLKKKEQELANSKEEFSQLTAKQAQINALLTQQKNAIIGLKDAESAVKAAEAAITAANNEKADLVAAKTQVEENYNLAKAAAERNLEANQRGQVAVQKELEILNNTTLGDNVVELSNQLAEKKSQLEVLEKELAVAQDAYDNARAAAKKAVTNDLLATTLFSTLYGVEDYVYSAKYSTITYPYDESTYINVSNFLKNVNYISPLDYESQTRTAFINRNVPVSRDGSATKPVKQGYTYSEELAFKALEVQNLPDLLNDIEGKIAAATTPVTAAEAAVASARAALAADPTNVGLQTALTNAQNDLATKQQKLNKVRTAQAKRREAYTALSTAANITAANDVLAAFNNKLADLADKYAVLKVAEVKWYVLNAEISALRTLGATTLVQNDGTLESTSKAARVKALNEKLAILKAEEARLKDAISNSSRAALNTNERNTAAKDATVALQTAIKTNQESLVAFYTAQLNYVKAQLAALGVQQ